MSEKILLHLLILCGVVCQGIIANSSNDDIQESSAPLARVKRVINLEASGQNPVRIQDFKYMTIIKEADRAKCTGVILSHYTVITAANCFKWDHTRYKILSGSGYTQNAEKHDVTSIVTHYGNSPHEPVVDGIALLTVDPLFTFGVKTGSIEMYRGPLTQGTQATISGWGCFYPLITAPAGLQRRLRKITVPIMNHQECLNIYRRNFLIGHKHVCTYHAQQYCAHHDIGAPLVINNQLAGIHVYKGEFPNQLNPEVFIDLQLHEYSEWIMQNTLLM